jgi:DnaJ-class molecular chaperone
MPICPNCNGVGTKEERTRLVTNTFTCPACQGKGKVDRAWGTKRPCRICQGLGFERSIGGGKMRCEVCNGMGLV